MPARRIGLLSAVFGCWLGVGCTFAMAQDLTGVNGGVNSDGGAMTGPTINRVIGINPNGTPRQQGPGASMTNGAGNSYMTPGVTGSTGGNTGLSTVHTVPPTVILHDNSAAGGNAP